MEKTTVLTKLDFRTLKYCNLFIMKFKRKSSIWFIVTALISAAIIVYDLVALKDGNHMFAILGGVFLVYSAYQFLNLEKRLDTQLARFFYNRRVTEQVVEITDEKIVVHRSVDPNNPIEYDWSFVTEICEMPQFYMLMIGRGSPVILDRSLEAIIEGTKENLDAIIKEKASMKPHKRTEQDIVKIPITFVHPEFPEVVSEETQDINETQEEKPLEVETTQTTTEDSKEE